MRALGAAVALVYALCFIGVCLGGCLAPEAARHGCCPASDGPTLSAAAVDCCTVVPGVTAKPVPPSPSGAPQLVPATTASLVTFTPVLPARPLFAEAGPPLVLRI